MKLQDRDYGRFSEQISASSPDGQLIRAQIELTYGCNLHCLHCYTDPFNRPDLMDAELATQEVVEALDQLQSEGVLWVCFTGGEPFMRPDFFTIYDAAQDRGFLVTLYSNGTLITDATADRLASRPPFSIELSIHGATAETFDEITQVPGSFSRFLDGLRRLLERGLPVKLKASGMNVNAHELEALAALAASHGLPFNLDTAIYPRLNGDTSPAQLRLSPEDRVAVERRFWGNLDHGECALGDGRRSDDVSRPAPDRLYRCGCGTNTVHIDSYGSVGACTWQREPRFSLRDRPLRGSVQDLFASIRGLRYRRETPCQSCPVHRGCEKMPGIAAAETGDIEAPVPHFCDTAHLRAGGEPKRTPFVRATSD